MKPSLILLTVGLSLTLGCSKDSNDSNNPASPGNHAPVIQSINASPQEVAHNGDSDLTCVATDPDRDSLTYTWSARFGSVSVHGAAATWHAPAESGIYWVKVIVSDGVALDVDSAYVSVVPPNTPPATPFDPRPGDYESNISPASVAFSWRCVDADGNSISYDFYFGNEYGSSLIERDLRTPYYQIDNLNGNTRYYWGVLARDSRGATSERTDWRFQTR